VPGRQTDFAAVRDEVAQLVRERGWRNVTLAGHSFGGSLAIALAASNPGLFARVVILDAYPFPAALIRPALTAEAARGVAAAVRGMMSGLSDEQYRTQQSQAFRTMITGDADYRMVLSWLFASDRETVMEAQFEALSSDLRPSLAKIAGPVLVLGCSSGRERLEDQYRSAVRCRIEVSGTARHFLMLDDPEWVARRIASFVAE
jgi:pimeloyl-ACP methyl ester carboxylesterase